MGQSTSQMPDRPLHRPQVPALLVDSPGLPAAHFAHYTTLKQDCKDIKDKQMQFMSKWNHQWIGITPSTFPLSANVSAEQQNKRQRWHNHITFGWAEKMAFPRRTFAHWNTGSQTAWRLLGEDVGGMIWQPASILSTNVGRKPAERCKIIAKFNKVAIRLSWRETSKHPGQLSFHGGRNAAWRPCHHWCTRCDPPWLLEQLNNYRSYNIRSV